LVYQRARNKNMDNRFNCGNNQGHYLSIPLLITIGLLFLYVMCFSTVHAFNPRAKEYVFVKKWGSEGTGDGEFKRIHDLDFDPSEKKLYVVDRDNNRIQVFDKNGTFLFKWGKKGTGEGEFNTPYSVDVDSQGDVWVADRDNSRIQKFDNDGNFIKEWGSKGKGPGQFILPVSVIMDSKGDIIIDERRHDRIQKFDNDGNFLL
jgi:tripartite motif-containing protein 71